MSWAESSGLRPMKPTTTTPSEEGGSAEEGSGRVWEGELEVGLAVGVGGGRTRTRMDDGFRFGLGVPMDANWKLQDSALFGLVYLDLH